MNTPLSGPGYTVHRNPDGSTFVAARTGQGIRSGLFANHPDVAPAIVGHISARLVASTHPKRPRDRPASRADRRRPVRFAENCQCVVVHRGFVGYLYLVHGEAASVRCAIRPCGEELPKFKKPYLDYSYRYVHTVGPDRPDLCFGLAVELVARIPDHDIAARIYAGDDDALLDALLDPRLDHPGNVVPSGREYLDEMRQWLGERLILAASQVVPI